MLLQVKTQIKALNTDVLNANELQVQINFNLRPLLENIKYQALRQKLNA